MKKKFLAGLATGVIMFSSAGLVSATPVYFSGTFSEVNGRDDFGLFDHSFTVKLDTDAYQFMEEDGDAHTKSYGSLGGLDFIVSSGTGEDMFFVSTQQPTYPNSQIIVGNNVTTAPVYGIDTFTAGTLAYETPFYSSCPQKEFWTDGVGVITGEGYSLEPDQNMVGWKVSAFIRFYDYSGETLGSTEIPSLGDLQNFYNHPSDMFFMLLIEKIDKSDNELPVSFSYYGEINDIQGSPPVPEPATMLLFGTGLVGLVGTKLRRKKK